MAGIVGLLPPVSFDKLGTRNSSLKIKASGGWGYGRKQVAGEDYGEPGYIRGQADNSGSAFGGEAYSGYAGGRGFPGDHSQRLWLAGAGGYSGVLAVSEVTVNVGAG